MSRVFKTTYLLLFTAFLCGCGEPEIVTYETEKKVHMNSVKKEKSDGHNHSPYAWDKPENWTQEMGRSMRLVSFGLTEGGLDVSIVQLGGAAGGIKANVNRWRGQLSLENESEENILKTITKQKSKIGEFSWTLLSNEKESFLVSIYNLPGATLFVKAKGSIAIIEQEKNNFLSLCRSIKANDHQH